MGFDVLGDQFDVRSFFTRKVKVVSATASSVESKSGIADSSKDEVRLVSDVNGMIEQSRPK